MAENLIEVSWATATDVGHLRHDNQDAVFPTGAGRGAPPVVLAVADGLGGMPGGDLAARTAIEAVAASAPTSTAPELVGAAVAAVQQAITNRRGKRPDLEMMSTTLTVGRIDSDGTLGVAHVGDSRLYLYSSGTLQQVTEDHTEAMRLVREGLLALDEAPDHPGWNVLSNWVGRDTAWIDRLTIPVAPADRVLVCSDGLTNMVSDADIASLLAAEPDDAACVQTLIDAANAAGGIDNITVAVASLIP